MSTFTYPIFYLLADIFEIFIIYRYMDLFFWMETTYESNVFCFCILFSFYRNSSLNHRCSYFQFNFCYFCNFICYLYLSNTIMEENLCCIVFVLLYGCSRIDSRQYNWLCKNGYDWRRQLSKCRRLNNHEIIILLRYFNIL